MGYGFWRSWDCYSEPGVRLLKKNVAEKAEKTAGPNVVAVRVVKEDGREIARTGGRIAGGSRKTAGSRRRLPPALRVLYQTGNFADIKSGQLSGAGGVRLDFVATENLYINQVIIEGLTAPPTDVFRGSRNATVAGTDLP